MVYPKSFASDNNAPVHPDIFKAMADANQGDVVAYGDDWHTYEVEKKFKEHFGEAARVFLVFNGTGANVTSLTQLTRPYNAIVCSDTAHLQHDECGAPEKFTGCKVHTLSSNHGKVRPEQVAPLLHSIGFQHHSQPKVISITQATELGTVYTPDEIHEFSQFASKNKMYLHMDGARLANAAAYLKVSLKELVTDTGVDVLSFGGTKNGLMFGEAVVFLNEELAEGFNYVRKQSMQLASKMRYISAQFSALLSNNLWLNNANHANQMAQLLALKVSAIKGVEITRPVQTNGVFATMPKHAIEKLLKNYFFYVWDESSLEVRWMTSFCTMPQDVEDFATAVNDSF
ncbi:MAG TPA: low specificity L-threonine aldolase [Bacteroidales bacterium]|nr:low specificity L-threonine aldolase [Bacteroidales bacterium]